MLMDYLVRLDVWWYSIVIPYRDPDIPDHSRLWLRNIAVTWSNVQDFMSRYDYLHNECEKEQIKKRGLSARSGVPPGSTLPSLASVAYGAAGGTSGPPGASGNA